MSEEFDQKEWDNLGQFLRKIYGLGDDMKYLANTFDEDKKKKSNDLTETLRKLSKAADVPASNKNAPEFVAYTQQLIVTLDKYFDLLRDVPDEI
jgi:outer membrane protein assembly factor BamE (lipoprotein component of BamABCDE complex)